MKLISFSVLARMINEEYGVRVHPRTLKRAARRGELGTVPVGKRLMISELAALTYMTRHSSWRAGCPSDGPGTVGVFGDPVVGPTLVRLVGELRPDASLTL